MKLVVVKGCYSFFLVTMSAFFTVETTLVISPDLFHLLPMRNILLAQFLPKTLIFSVHGANLNAIAVVCFPQTCVMSQKKVESTARSELIFLIHLLHGACRMELRNEGHSCITKAA